MTRFADAVRSTSADLSISQLLQQPATELLGVDAGAAIALKNLGIETIFDLGSSSMFARAAAALAASATDFGLVATDVLDTSAPNVPTTELGELPLRHLRGISAAKATDIENTLHVATVREFALWPPRQLARQIVSIAAGSSVENAEEASAEALRPRLGEYPTERVYYDTLIMLGTQQEGNLTPFTQPLSLSNLTNNGLSFGAPAIGALATYSQSWFAQGITLGHMVHSLALAPGEATRVAVIDWARRTSASASESINESERLDNSTLHARAVSEVQNAVANELQYGGSIATGWSKSTSKGSGFSGSIGGGIAGTIGEAAGVLGWGIGGSSSKQTSETESRATSASWSVGSRSVMSNMNQRVNDRTEQHATSVRNRRASAVREVSQSEHEEVSTRIVANYNHMHALTVQYYEVVQVYRVAVQLHKFDRVLFLPFQLLDFSGPHATDFVARFRSALLAAALTERAANLLLDDRGRVEVHSAIRVAAPINIAALAAANINVATAEMSSAITAPGTGGTGAVSGVGNDTSVTAARTAVRQGPIVEVLPGDARLVAIGFEDAGIARVRIDVSGVPAATNTFVVPPATDQVDLTSEILLRSVESIHVARDASTRVDGSMVLRYESEGRQSIAVVPLSLSAGDRMQKVAYFAADTADRRAELHAHLHTNRGYYTRAVLEGLDSASLVLLLAGISWQGKPLADQVEPNPIAVSGNFLVLRAPAEPRDPSGLANSQTWADLLNDREITLTKQDTRLVPIPTGGVFAEAVLGRSNSAEKLDITRFWNWQDSPIPLQPPEIAPIGTGSRMAAEDLHPGQLGAPVLNLMTPTVLPDSAGLSAVLGAIASGNMFRDMSGLAGTQAAAQAASAGTLTTATEAGRIASENYKAATTQATEMGKAAADMWKVMKQSERSGSGGNGSDGGKSGAGISGDGARINHGRDLDQRGVPGQSGSRSNRTGGGDSGVMETHPTFAASRQVVEPAAFSRELAYSDESAAASPRMIGATTAALGGGGSMSAAFTAASAGIGGPLGSLMMAPSIWQAVVESVLIGIMRSDANRVGIALQSVDLLPMRLHDNHIEFEQVGFYAWTNSAKHVYVNIPQIIKLFTDTLNNGVPASDALAFVRAIAASILRHEELHVIQFGNNGNQPPPTFQSMITFEEKAYGKTVTWLQTQAVQNFLLNDIGASQVDINDLITDLSAANTKFANWKANVQTEQKRKDAMANAAFLPETIRNNKDYAPGDLYLTTPP